MEENKIGLEAISDDELEAAAGGAGDDVNYRELAKAEGRHINVHHRVVQCGCGADATKVFCRSTHVIDGVTNYFDIKCYVCGQTWEREKSR